MEGADERQQRVRVGASRRRGYQGCQRSRQARADAAQAAAQGRAGGGRPPVRLRCAAHRMGQQAGA
eukprot:3123757-Pleurochrysis_carterae.AAC.1